jgi:malate dehydrogenase (oxaloacetate-decarboxylating)
MPIDTPNGKFMISQCNNMYVFPGIGLGPLISKSPKVTSGMFLAASKALSGMVTTEQQNHGLLLPDMEDIRKVSLKVAFAAAREAPRKWFWKTHE